MMSSQFLFGISLLCCIVVVFCLSFFMSLLIQGSEYRLEEYLKGMNWFMISWRLCLKRSQTGSGESVSGGLVLNFVS